MLKYFNGGGGLEQGQIESRQIFSVSETNNNKRRNLHQNAILFTRKECFPSILIKKISFLCANVLNRFQGALSRLTISNSRNQEEGDFEMLLVDLIEM